MTASIQTMMEKIKAVVFETKELECRNTSKTKILLPLLTYQDSDSNAGKNLGNLKKIVFLQENAID